MKNYFALFSTSLRLGLDIFLQRKYKIKLNVSLKERQVIWLSKICYSSMLGFNFSEEKEEEKKSLGFDPKHW